MMAPANTESAQYLDQPAEVNRFLDQIADVTELALDTEGASFHRFLDRIYLLQISTRERSAIIDPLPIGSPPKLGDLLQSNSVEVVFHEAALASVPRSVEAPLDTNAACVTGIVTLLDAARRGGVRRVVEVLERASDELLHWAGLQQVLSEVALEPAEEFGLVGDADRVHGAVLRRPPRLSLAAAKEEAVAAVLGYLHAH